MWDLTGMCVEGYYVGIPVKGTVVSSRVKYGGDVQHTVTLVQPIMVFGAVRTRVLINRDDVTRVYNETGTIWSK